MRLKRKTNGPLWVDLESVAVKGPDGEITGGRLVLSDIMERKRSEEALRASEERFQDLSSKLLDLQEMERKVLANEIHDEFLSDLAAVYYSLEANIKTLSKESHPIVPELQDLLKILQRAIKEAQRIMNRLRPTILDEVGLIPALTGFCREFRERYPHIQVECKLEAQENEIPDPIKVVIFRVAQEAMTNSARYGRADGSVKVSLTRSLDRIEFLAQDNGPGFDLGRVKKGVGLESMRERVEISEGTFKIESAIDRGTKICAIWNLS
jgi:signal transduction histidine kinase